MPLLAQDEFGRVYQTEGLSEFDDAAVGYFAEIDDTDNVYFGEMSDGERKRVARLKKLRRKQAQIAAKKRAAKIRYAKKLQLLKAKKERLAQRRIQKLQEQKRKRHNMYRLAQIRASKNAFAGYEQTTVGNPLAGWQDGEAILNSSDWGRVGVSGVEIANEFGQDNFHCVDHPMMGFGFNYHTDDESMGFRNFSFKRPAHAPPMPIAPGRKRKKRRGLRIKTPKQLKKLVKEVGKGAAAVYKAPLKLANKVLTQAPIIKNVYKGVDKMTGGTLTSLNKTLMLPGKALEGKAISKAEFMESLGNVIKVGAIIVTGGAASSVVSASSSALAKGPLGKTSLGRALLSVGEVTSLSSLGGTSLKTAMEKKVTDLASQKAASEAAKKAGPLGAIVASAAVQAGSAGISPKASETVTKSAITSSKAAGQIAAQNAAQQIKIGAIKFDSVAAQQKFIESAKAQAERKVQIDFQKKTGVPLNLASDVVQGRVPSTTEIYDKMKNELYGTPEQLEMRIAQIKNQMSPNEPLFQKVLETKALIMTKELAERKALIASTDAESGEKLAKANQILKEKGLKAMAAQTVLAELGRKHDLLSQSLLNANIDEKERITREMALLQNQIIQAKADHDRAVGEAEEAARAAEYEKDLGAFKSLQAQYGGPGAREKYLETDDSYIHPMLRYELITRKA